MNYARLWKRILHEGLRVPPGMIPANRPDYVQNVTKLILQSPIIVDPVVQPMGEYDYNWNRYVSMSIPFDRFWVEGQLGGPDELWGTKVSAIRIEDDCPASLKKVDVGGWVLQLMYCVAGKDHAPSTVGKILIWVDKDGVLLDAPRGELVFIDMLVPDLISFLPDGVPEIENPTLRHDCARQIAQTVCDVLVLLGCKNVGLSAITDNKQFRIATKRHGPSSTGYRYHVLVVRPAGGKSDSPGIEIGTMPRHVCRGHFAEYGPDFGKGLLFGRLAGRFYIPPHVRGNTEYGEVAKDYLVV